MRRSAQAEKAESPAKRLAAFIAGFDRPLEGSFVPHAPPFAGDGQRLSSWSTTITTPL